jgi:hypothetical protein
MLFLGAWLACACSGKAPPTRADPSPTPWNKAPPLLYAQVAVSSPAEARRLAEDEGFEVIAVASPEAACSDARWAWACAGQMKLVAIDELPAGARAIVVTDW